MELNPQKPPIAKPSSSSRHCAQGGKGPCATSVSKHLTLSRKSHLLGCPQGQHYWWHLLHNTWKDNVVPKKFCRCNQEPARLVCDDLTAES